MVDNNAYWSSTNDTVSPLPGGTLNARTSHQLLDLNGSSTWTYGYDNSMTTANLTSETNSAVVITHSYDSAGNLLTTTDGNKVVTKYTYAAAACVDGASYSSFAYADTITRDFGGPLARTTTQTWDCKTGLLKSTTDPNNVSTNYSYDLMGRKTLIDEAVGSGSERKTTIGIAESNSGSGALTPLTVTTSHNLSSTTDTSVVTIQEFDQRGVLTNTRNPAGATTQTYGRLSIPADGLSYEATSNPFLSSTDPTIGWTVRTYDTSNRLTAVEHFSGAPPPCPFTGSSTPTTCSGTAGPDSLQTTTYDGYVSTDSDEAGVARTYTADGFGRLHSVQEGCTGCQTTYTYDYGDRLATVTQGSQTRTFTYDSLGRLAGAQNPESGSTTFTYDNNANVKSKQTPIGTVSYNYDDLNRITTQTYLDSTPPVTYCYDGITTAAGCSGSPTGALLKDRLTMVQNSKSVALFSEYDEVGQVIQSRQTTGSQTFSFTYGYNRLGGLQTLTYPSGRTVTMGFDNAGRITAVTNQATGLQYASAVTYAPNDVVSGVRLGNGLTESTTFNTRFQPTQIKAANLLTLALTYGSANNGNLASQTIVRPSGTWMQTYNYDGVNRLVCANEVGGAASLTCGTGTPNWWLTFGYDGWGNHWLSNDPNGAGIPISPFTPKSQTDYDGSNHLLTDSALFDTAGNQKQIGGFQFGYDSENRLTSSVFTPTSASQTTAQYDYDGFGRRVRKTVNGQATTYVYDAAGQLAVEYGSTTDAGTNYLTADHLGSTRLITDARGSVARCYDYLPFGEEIGNGTAGRTDPCFGSATYPAPQDIESAKFTGKQRDAETGLDYFGARYFSAAQGRFMSPDSTAYSKMSNPQSWNLYAYSFNNPLRFIDPTGNEVQAANCGTEQGCQKTLAAVRGSLANQQAANRVGLQKIERGFWGRIGAWITGAPQFRFTISGDMASFKALGQNASRFGQLVENKTVVTAAVSDMYPSYGGSQRTTPGGFSGLPSKGLDPAATVANNPTPFDTDASPGANVNETMAHELLGHVWGEIVANHPAESFWNLRDSVEAENAVRATDPSRGLKFQHHGDPSPTVVYSQQEIEEMQKKR